MGRAERVVFALDAPREARQAAGLAQRADLSSPTRQNLVWICLMADVPNKSVARRVTDILQHYGELDNAKTGSKMTPGDRHGIDSLLPDFGSELRQLGLSNLAQSFRRVYPIDEVPRRWLHN